MNKFLWKCGHTSEGDCCSICGCEQIEFRIHNVRDHLDGRQARCGNKIIKSRWDLPGFIYRPNEEYDLFLFGNSNSSFTTGTVYSIGIDRDKIRIDKKESNNGKEET